jgi:hypothetical protein
MAKNTRQKEDKTTIESGSYEIIRDRLNKHGSDLRQRLQQLNNARKAVFGSIDVQLLTTERVTTKNNCYARDLIALGDDLFIFGYNVHMGLKTETHVDDVFSLYRFDKEEHLFHQHENVLLQSAEFVQDFANLYRYYRDTRFAKFAQIGPSLFLVFRVGKTANDIKTFKWTTTPEGELRYVDNRSDHEFTYPDQHAFRWKKALRDMHRKGAHPHISIEDRVFVETVGGDLTIKIEDNTDSGQGIFEEPVENPDQTLDDAELYYASIGNLIVLKIKPYQEDDFRYIVYNEKIQQAVRIDALEDSCVLLPDDQGIIFAKGYYNQTGEVKLFDNQLSDMLFEKRLASPNGEDFLYIFYQKESGTYALMLYNIIKQEVDTPIICNGYSLFDNGELLFFKSEDEQKKHHLIQIWQTPFYSPNKTVSVENDSYLFKLGNKEIVQAMAEAGELLKLLRKEDSYANLYVDLVKVTTGILDSYHWLNHKEAFALSEPLQRIKNAASQAIEEFEKVVRMKKTTADRFAEVAGKAGDIIKRSKRGDAKTIYEFVERLGLLRKSKGEIISLKELPYVDTEKIQEYEQELSQITEKLSQSAAAFLLKKEALEPYRTKVAELNKAIEKADKVVKATQLLDDVGKISTDLEMLIEIVSNLNIDDATQSTQIIDSISAIYAQFNRISASLKKKRKTLMSKEGEAEFNAQLKLINQALTNYLDVSDSPEKCEDYRNKLMVQIEELEGRFAEFEQYIVQISEKREDIYNAFETKKVQLMEARQRRTLALHQSGERIISGISKRLAGFNSLEDINAYYASDMMVDKVRSLTDQLLALNDAVKADDLQSKLKSTYEEATRQLKDKKELFVNGSDVIQLGNHSFNVNTQSIDLSMISRDDAMYFHINGTNFFEQITSPEFLATHAVWQQTLVSENEAVYRAEYLAYQLFRDAEAARSENNKEAETLEVLHQYSGKALLGHVQRKMTKRYDEGYVKGIHDRDTAAILRQLLVFYHTIGLLRYAANSRVLAYLFWNYLIEKEEKRDWELQFKSIRSIRTVFPDGQSFLHTRSDLAQSLTAQCKALPWFDEQTANQAAEFLFHLLTEEGQFIFSLEAWQLHDKFTTDLRKKRSLRVFQQSIKELGDDITEQLKLAQYWLQGFARQNANAADEETLREAGLLLLQSGNIHQTDHKLSLQTTISGLHGDHPRITNGTLQLHYTRFMQRLYAFTQHDAERFRRFTEMKKQLLREAKNEMRLSEFKPRVMSSFVRNRLINDVYLPLIGDNLAKQIGAAGNSKRTDLMGLLLLISPPGYGKTTLMEYLANRLGLVFMKINGPAIGHDVTNLDPTAASHAAAREELEKLNLAFEMGDNVMIYLDDIQHCNPELLQKFISLCDAQRKIEGVYKGVSKTYDLRGKKVAVVMAGNPYTESGEKFRIPDMLANRADTYNLGDIIGGKQEAFELSFLENSLTSNTITARLHGKSQSDLYSLVHMAQTGERDGVSLEASYSPDEVNDYLKILTHMLAVRDVVLRVNKAYIQSAGQNDAYRTEPPFLLQGSYRDMNKLVEKLNPLMNEDELHTLILSHYQNESQTLTTGAEFNLLKFKELYGVISEEEKTRKDEIVALFMRQQKLSGLGGNEVGHVLEQMESIADGLSGISESIRKAAKK